MELADTAAKRATCDRGRSGCVIVKDDEVIARGYNRRMRDMNALSHAEMNAILNYRGTRKELENSKIYVDLFPCNECAKLIVQAGIKEVVFLSDKFKDKEGNLLETDSVKASKKMFKECGVKMTEVNLNKNKITIDLEKR